MKREDIYAAIDTERLRQEELHPGWPWDHGTSWRAGRHEVLESEVREARESIRTPELREELIHVASVAVRWLEAL